ncbi:MAG: sugar transferase, partial [Bryobacterales bacterium]|nr:sugar transferase [Bryobacteraceae bacterium]MDW8130513.1 sugar transferase [Bryobacterales bacterium]
MVRFFRVSVPTGVFLLVVSEALLLTSAYTATTYLALQVDPTVFLLYDGGLARILVSVASVMLALHFLDLYSGRWAPSRTALGLALAQAFGFAFLFQAFLAYLSRSWMLPRSIMLPGSAAGFALCLGWRLFYDGVLTQAIGAHRVLFLGARHALVEEIAAYLDRHPELGMQNVGYLDDELPAGTVLHGAKILGPTNTLRKAVAQTRPDRIVVGLSERRQRLPLQDLLDLRFSGLLVEEVAATYETIRGRVSTKELRPAQLIFSGELGPRPAYVRLQTLYSLVLAAVGLVATLPLMLLVALAVKLTSRGPVLYRQTRVGLHGRHFTLYKFRSMYADAEARTGVVWAAKDDPRVTPVGRWLRRLRLDELPQFINVLRGEMAIVGPRPE